MCYFTPLVCKLLSNTFSMLPAKAALLSLLERRIVFVRLLFQCPYWAYRAVVSLIIKILRANIPTTAEVELSG